MMKSLIQGTQEWKELRKPKITASDACVIMGVSPWKKIEDLLKEKLDLKEEDPENFIQKQGKIKEELAREKFEEITGLLMFPVVAFHHKFDWMMASLDGLTLCKTKILEIKCPGKKDHETAIQGKIPPKYYPQLQHQLAVTDLPMVYYFSFDGVNNVIIEVQRDDTYIDYLIECEMQFLKCMQDFKRII